MAISTNIDVKLEELWHRRYFLFLFKKPRRGLLQNTCRNEKSRHMLGDETNCLDKKKGKVVNVVLAKRSFV